MENTQTRSKINLKDGSIELEGTEGFVKEQLERFSKLILKHYDFNNVNVRMKEDEDLFEERIDENTKSNDKFMLHFGIEKDKLYEIIYFNEDKFKIIAHDIKGNSNAEKQENLTLLYCLAKEFVCDEIVDSNEIRNICEEYGCLDSKNFSTYLKRRTNYFIISGDKGSPNKQIKLTVPGKKAARVLIKEMVNEG